jgi:hypothetical protein
MLKKIVKLILFRIFYMIFIDLLELLNHVSECPAVLQPYL